MLGELTRGTLVGGKFRVVAKLGQGGMGTVYEAEHVELHHRVAIKVILSTEQNDEMLKRFQREAIVLGQLESDQVVRVLDFGTLKDGTPYLVMEFLKGTDLQEHIRANGPLSVEEVAEIGIAVCDALSDAHGKGIVHRDIKPSNIFLVDRPGRRTVKVLDFGVSLLRRPGDESLTHAHAVLGTPLYTAPEQLTASKTADGRADLWALGASMFELVTGEVPFPAATLSELARLLQKPPRLASSVNSKIPESFAKVLSGCLQRNLQERYASAQELRRALKPFRGIARTSSVFGVSLADDDREALVRSEKHALPSAAPIDADPSEVTDVSGAPTFAEVERNQQTPKVALVPPARPAPSTPPSSMRWVPWAVFTAILTLLAAIALVFVLRAREPKVDTSYVPTTATSALTPVPSTPSTVATVPTLAPSTVSATPSMLATSTPAHSGAPVRAPKVRPAPPVVPTPRSTLIAPGER